MPAKNVIELLQNSLTPDIARQNRFQVDIRIDSNIGSVIGNNDVELLDISSNFIKTATIPRLVTKTIEMRRAGKKIHYPGGMDYENLFFSFHNDVNGRIREFFHKWQQKYYGDFGDGGASHTDLARLMKAGTIHVYQLDGSNYGSKQTKHTFEHCFPTILADIEFGHDNEDSLSSFNVTFVYNKQLFKRLH